MPFKISEMLVKLRLFFFTHLPHPLLLSASFTKGLVEEVLQRLTGIKLGERKLGHHVASCSLLL